MADSIDATAFKAMQAKPGKYERKENETASGLRVYGQTRAIYIPA